MDEERKVKHSKFSEQIEEAISNPTPLGVKLKQARALGLTATIPTISILPSK